MKKATVKPIKGSKQTAKSDSTQIYMDRYKKLSSASSKLSDAAKKVLSPATKDSLMKQASSFANKAKQSLSSANKYQEKINKPIRTIALPEVTVTATRLKKAKPTKYNQNIGQSSSRPRGMYEGKKSK
jgi:hypothetical protein